MSNACATCRRLGSGEPWLGDTEPQALRGWLVGVVAGQGAVGAFQTFDAVGERADGVDREREREDPVEGDLPWVTLSPKHPHSAAGTRIEPPVSVPMATG